MTLFPSDDPLKVATVRWLFETYANQDLGYRALAEELNRRGVASPNGRQWYDSSVRAILQNHVYIGTFIWGKRREGKYHRVAGTEIVQRDRRERRVSPKGKPNAIDNPEDGWIVVENAHEALIDQETFQTVQAKIQRCSRGAGQGYRTHTKRNGDAYLLSGLVYCEQCGRKMHGAASTRRKNGKSYRYERYVCSSYTRGGASCESGCRHYAVRQDLLYDVIIAKLRERLFADGNLDRLKDCMRDQLRRRCQPDTAQLDRLQRRLKELDKDLARFSQRWFTAPESLLPRPQPSARSGSATSSPSRWRRPR